MILRDLDELHLCYFAVNLRIHLTLTLEHVGVHLKPLDLQACVDIIAAYSALDIPNKDDTVLCIETHGRQVQSHPCELIFLADIVQVHRQASIFAVVNPQTIFCEDKEVLIRLKELNIDRWIYHSVPLLVCRLSDFRKATLLKDEPPDLEVFLFQNSTWRVAVC